ncbi:MAG: hypothetical protein IJS22_00475 [Lachnospiraceae bacterium]|nr:hypothetical protein [Lachnospiraceae bacterium]
MRQFLAVLYFLSHYLHGTEAVHGSCGQLAAGSDTFIYAGVGCEGGPLNRAPRASVLTELIALQALSVVLQGDKNWDPVKYVRCHPGEALGILREGEDER